MLSITQLFCAVILVLLFSKSTAHENEVKQRVSRQETCDPSCTIRIDESFDYTTNLHQTASANHGALVQRVANLENEFFDAVGRLNVLIERFNAVNVTNLHNRITDEIRNVNDFINYEVEIIRKDYNTKFNNLTAEISIIKNGGNGGPLQITDGYYNITKRIDSLEFGKISNLTADNSIWRKNFRVINATFEKIKANNNCLCK